MGAYSSLKQLRFAHTPNGLKAFGAKEVKKRDKASKGLRLPLRVKR